MALVKKSLPKQYLSIDSKSEFSFLQITLNRIKVLGKGKTIIICNEEHRFITAEQIRSKNKAKCDIVRTF